MTTVTGVTKSGELIIRFGNGRRTRRGRDRARARFATFARAGTLSHTETCEVFRAAGDAGGICNREK